MFHGFHGLVYMQVARPLDYSENMDAIECRVLKRGEICLKISGYGIFQTLVIKCNHFQLHNKGIPSPKSLRSPQFLTSYIGRTCTSLYLSKLVAQLLSDWLRVHNMSMSQICPCSQPEDNTYVPHNVFANLDLNASTSIPSVPESLSVFSTLTRLRSADR